MFHNWQRGKKSKLMVKYKGNLINKNNNLILVILINLSIVYPFRQLNLLKGTLAHKCF